MAEIRATASRDIAAPPEVVYDILADYRVGHPSTLPKRAFLSLDVEEGGVGAGTVIRYEMRAFGVTRRARARISEPTPGRVLLETDLDTGLQTTFEVVPVEGGQGSRVSILTTWTSKGLQRWVERLLAPRYLRKLYAEELENLARKAEGESKAGRPA